MIGSFRLVLLENAIRTGAAAFGANHQSTVSVPRSPPEICAVVRMWTVSMRASPTAIVSRPRSAATPSSRPCCETQVNVPRALMQR